MLQRLKSLPLPVLIILGVVLYIATAIPLGVLAYTLKNSIGFNVFNRAGIHSFTKCVKQQYENEKFGEGVWSSRTDRERQFNFQQWLDDLAPFKKDTPQAN
jgi:hypothetical protein